jgi:hypothetical protein
MVLLVIAAGVVAGILGALLGAPPTIDKVIAGGVAGVAYLYLEWRSRRGAGARGV